LRAKRSNLENDGLLRRYAPRNDGKVFAMTRLTRFETNKTIVMKIGFLETIKEKTDKELEIISKDAIFYSEDERFIALNELKLRGKLNDELTETKKDIKRFREEEPKKLDFIPTYKIYGKWQHWVATYIGGPLVAGYIIAENFKAFNEHDKAKKTWLYTIVATILILIGAFFIPEEILIAFPNAIIPMIYTLTAYAFMYHFQNKNISAHKISEGKFFSWWRVVGIGLIGLVSFLLLGTVAYLIIF